nr:DUF5677 domain-containing protein [uncultured Hyphomonas sp.]
MAREFPLQETFEKIGEKVPELILKDLIEKKLQDLEVSLSEESIKRVAREILAADMNSVTIDLPEEHSGPDKTHHLSLTFTDEDNKALKDKAKKLLENLPDIIDRTVTKTAKRMLKTFNKQWHMEASLRRSELTAFSERLIYRWRKGLVPLNIILEISREYGATRLDEETSNDNSTLTPKADLIFGLHMRACQVAAEIITLLEAGYADGAMARWRTLFEISVIATIIFSQDNEIARKYVDHNQIDIKKAASRYMETLEHSGGDAIPEEELAQIEEEYQRLLKIHGKNFRNEYGWASNVVGKDNPNLTDLIVFAQSQANLSHYKMASFNVHAGARALFFRQTDMVSHSGLLSGASNAGLEEPGASTASTLCHITSFLMPEGESPMDDIVFLETLVRLRDKAIKGFFSAARQLNEEDEAEFKSLEEFLNENGPKPS